MRAFFAYLKTKKAFGLFFVLATGLLCLSFYLYRLPMKAVLYPLALCFAVGLCMLAVSYTRFSERLKQLRRAGLLTRDSIPGSLPRPVGAHEETYEQLVKSLIERGKADEAAREKALAEAEEYFMLWAHQIKTPIAAMRLTLQNEDSALSHTLQNDLGRVDRYADMVMTYLRLRSPSTDYVLKKHDIHALARAAVRNFAGEFILRKLKLDLDAFSLTAVTDEKWLLFVLEQILSNALKYTKTGGIHIYMEKEGVLCIADTGIGIAKEDLPRVTQRGYTGFNGRQDMKASGIGLYLARGICDRLGHGLHISSVLGRGTTVRLDFRQNGVQE